MKKPLKISLIVISGALLACLASLFWLLSRPDEPDEPGQAVGSVGSDTSRGPSFEVHVDRPRSDRFLFGILPTRIEAKLIGGELRFNHASRGARIGSVRPEHLELSADGWDMLVETDSEGRIASATRLVFPIEIAGKQWTLRCRPADPAVGYLHANTRPGSDVLDGRFLVELARCEDATTGKILDTEAGGNPGQAWPSAPLTLRGSFAGLPPGRP